MLLEIYIIGACLCILWFALVAIMVFENWAYENQDEEGRGAIQSVRDVLNDINPENPQRTYVMFSIFITLLWPVMVPYMIIKSKFG